MSKFFILTVLLVFSYCMNAEAQEKLDKLSWSKVVYDQADNWYGSKEAIRVAENVLLYQRDVGGWPKNTSMHLALSEKKINELRTLKALGTGTTIDNGATVMELDFLSKVYHKTKDERFKTAFIKGIDYLLDAQYEKGGWPQYYPLRKGYYTHITYNDNAMVNVMNVIKSIAERGDRFSMELDDATISKAKTAYEKGIEIILKTQYKQNGVLTVWCAQHDEKTLLPALARSYELPSLSGSESVDIVLLLMEIENPSQEIITSVQSAVAWFDQVKIEGIRIERVKNSEGQKDRMVIQDKDAPALWARFYDLVDNRPFFCDRDGIKKYSLAEIGHERRNGYGWYDNDPKDVLKAYKSWQPKWAHESNVLDKSNQKKSYSVIPAFPSAEGAGKFALGGRGGDVYHVTSLEDTGQGTLRQGIETINGSRTIVFDVAGMIRLKSKLEIRNVSYLTIAGQSAPGKGITIADYPVKIHNSKHIIVRYLRIRLGDENKPLDSGFDCIEVNYDEDIILDHLSLSWGIDGNGDFRGLKNATIQWCIFSEALNNSIHEKGAHGMCSSFRDPRGQATLHHNIYASSRNRHPSINGGPAVTEFCNNIDYNWHNSNNIAGEQINVMGNYYKAGPSMAEGILPIQFKAGKDTPVSKGFLFGNYFEGLPKKYNEDNYTAMNYEACFGPNSNYKATSRKEFEVSKRFDAGKYQLTTIQSAEEAYQTCLKFSGCSLVRDLVDERFIKTVMNNTGKIIDSQSEVGGWDHYDHISRPDAWDTDGDGMPDEWEKLKGLEPSNGNDNIKNTLHMDYTNIEVYLNELVN